MRNRFFAISSLVALGILAPQRAQAQCVACNGLIQGCSWGPWGNGYLNCVVVGSDCFQTNPCAATLRTDLLGEMLVASASSIKTLLNHQPETQLGLVSSGLAYGSLIDGARDCRGFLLPTVLSSADEKPRVAAPDVLVI